MVMSSIATHFFSDYFHAHEATRNLTTARTRPQPADAPALDDAHSSSTTVITSWFIRPAYLGGVAGLQSCYA